MKKRVSEILKLKLLFITGAISEDEINEMLEKSGGDDRIKLLKSEIGWYMEEISTESNPLHIVEKVCAYFGINFFLLSRSGFFDILKSVKEQNDVVSAIIRDIEYPELTEIQRQAGYGEKHFGIAGLICNLAEAFKIDYIQAEKQPVIALTKLRMNAHLAMCMSNEKRINEMMKME